MDQNQAETPEEKWVKVGHYPNLREAYDHGLVVLAMGESCRVEEAEAPGEYDLQIELEPAPKITRELDAYGREIAMARSAVNHQSFEWFRHPAGWSVGVIWALLLTILFLQQGSDPGLVERYASSGSGFLKHGEWWRPFTGLFFHADVPHLVGNLAGGVIFGALVSRSIGAAKGWALILGCGTLGNAMTSLLTYSEPIRSIGASTAVFAALGILAGLGILETLAERARLTWVRIAAPVLAGVVLLGWMGSGGPNTDVMGHVLGFGSGLAGGVVVGRMTAPKPI